MKKIVILVLSLTLGFSFAQAQVPSEFNYQALLRTDSGLPLVNTTVVITAEIYSTTAGGVALYIENIQAQTNAFGVVNLSIGKNPIIGNLRELNWSTGEYYIQISVGNVPVGGRSKLLSVPYALYAGNTTWSDYLIAYHRDNASSGGGATPNTNVNSTGDFMIPLNYVNSSSGTAITFNPSTHEVTITKPGKYHVYAQGEGYLIGRHRIFLANSTGNTLLWGTNSYSPSAASVSTSSFIDGIINVTTAPMTVTLQHYYGNGSSSPYAFGVNGAGNDVYATLRIQKIE